MCNTTPLTNWSKHKTWKCLAEERGAAQDLQLLTRNLVGAHRIVLRGLRCYRRGRRGAVLCCRVAPSCFFRLGDERRLWRHDWRRLCPMTYVLWIVGLDSHNNCQPILLRKVKRMDSVRFFSFIMGSYTYLMEILHIVQRLFYYYQSHLYSNIDFVSNHLMIS